MELNPLLEEYLRRMQERSRVRIEEILAGADCDTLDDRDPDEELLLQAILQIQRETGASSANHAPSPHHPDATEKTA